jgi:hypothetical protein
MVNEGMRRGTYFEETNDRCFGILSEGSEPLSSNDVKFNVGRTGDQLVPSELVSNRGDIRRANIVSCVKSTYLSYQLGRNMEEIAYRGCFNGK